MLGLLTVAVSLTLSISAAADAVPPLGPAADIPSIGLRIALPSGMTDLPLDSLTDWVRVGIKADGDSCRAILVLSALPEGSMRSARSAADRWVRQSTADRTGYGAISQKPVAWMSNGWEVLATYRAGEKAVTSLQWYGWRDGRPAVIYVLTYDVVDGQSAVMRGLVEAVAASCVLTPIRPACTQPVRLGTRRFLPNQGVSLAVPDTLRLMEPNRPGMMLRAGAVDYLRDRLLPVLTLTANAVQAGETPEVRLKRTVDSLLPSLRPVEAKIASSQPAGLGGRPGFQVSFCITLGRERLNTAVRLAIWRDKAWVLSLTYPEANARQLAEAMEGVAGSFQFEP